MTLPNRFHCLCPGVPEGFLGRAPGGSAIFVSLNGVRRGLGSGGRGGGLGGDAGAAFGGLRWDAGGRVVRNSVSLGRE